MIHIFEISADTTPAQARKSIRRSAMTGGVEIAIAPGLDSAALENIAASFEAELNRYQAGSLLWKASSAFRILRLIYDHQHVSAALRQRLERLLLI